MRCPGQDSRYWKPDAVFEVPCNKCGSPVEFFKDETTRRCRSCGQKMVNPRFDFACAAYCTYAEQCLGELPAELVAERRKLLKDRVAIEVKKVFQKDFKRIGHALKVARYAERMAREWKGDLPVILSAAYLHDIGIKEAESRYNSSEPRYQEELGPPIARKILTSLGAPADLIGEVCEIIAHHHHPRFEETTNFKVVHDADLIVNLEEAYQSGAMDPQKLEDTVETSFLTETGKALAREIFSIKKTSNQNKAP